MQKSLIMNRGTDGSVTLEYDSADMWDQSGVESRKTLGLHCGWGLDGVTKKGCKWMWIYGLSDGFVSVETVNVLNTRLVRHPWIRDSQLNSVDGSRKIKVIKGNPWEKSLIDRFFRSNIAQIHHLIHSYHFIFIYSQYDWNNNFIWL